MSISVTVSGEDATSVVLEQVLSDAVTVSGSNSIQVTTTSGDAATVTISTGDPVTVTGNYSNYVTGDVVRPNEISDFLTSAQISSDINSAIDSLIDSAPDALNTLNELAAALNDDENFGSDTIVSISNLNSATGQLSTATGLLVQKSETGIFYTNDNPSGFITGVDLSDLEAATGNLDSRITSNDGDISALQTATGLLVQKTETGDFVTTFDTGAFYANSNPSGFITGVDLSSYVQNSETGNFITDSDTGAFYAASNPSGFITGVDLSSYVQDSETGLFLVSGEDAVVNTIGVGGSPDPDIDIHVKSNSAKFLVENTLGGGEWVRFSAGTIGSSMKFSNTASFSIGPVASKTDTSLVDDFYMASNGNVGIGTDTPLAKLEIAGSATPTIGVINATNTNFINGTDTPTINARFPTNNASTFGSMSMGKYGGGNNGVGLRFQQVEGTDRLIFRGSSFPGAMVWSQPEADAQLLIDIPNRAFRFTDDLFTPMRESVDLGGNTSSTRWDNLYANNGYFNNGLNVNNLFVVDSSGDVGVGINSPSAKLHSNGTNDTDYLALFTSNGATPNLSQTDDVKRRAIAVQGEGAAYYIGRDLTNNIEFVMGTSTAGVAFLGSLTNHGVDIRVNNQNALKINTAKDVTVVGGHLNVDSDSKYLKLGASQDAGIIYNGTNMVFDSQLVGAGDFVFENGNVGIGTDTPSATLDIASSSSDTPLVITKANEDGVRETLMIATVAGTSNNEKFFINNGTIGNGNFAPVFGGYTEQAGLWGLGFAGFLDSTADGSDSSTYGVVDFMAARTTNAASPLNGTISNLQNRKAFTFRGENSNKMYMSILANGNVGIGTDTPNYKLDVNGQINAYSSTYPVLKFTRETTASGTNGDFGDIQGIGSAMQLITKSTNNITDGFGGGIVFSILDDTFNNETQPIARIYARRDGADNRGALQFFTQGSSSITPSMIIRNDGNVGIGTDTPGRKLSVAGAIELTTADTTLNTAHAAIRRGSAGEMFLDAPGNISLTIDSNNNQTTAVFNVRKDAGTELFRVQENGDVGIGTTSPSAKLDVSGDANIDGTLTVDKISLSDNSFIVETGDFTLSDSHKGATILLQNTAAISITIPALSAGHTTSFIAETANTVTFQTGVGISGFNSFGNANQIAGIFGQAQVLYKTSEYAFLGGNIS